MGTHIDCFFAHQIYVTPAALQGQLDDLCAQRCDDVEYIVEHGRFSGGLGRWSVWQEHGAEGEPQCIAGEGPAGLGIAVYRRVIKLTSVERFHALCDESSGVAVPLRRVLCSIASQVAAAAQFAVAAGGLGDTDAADDVAYYRGGSFEEVCACLTEKVGPPATMWKELQEGAVGWYFGPPAPAP